MIRWSWIYCACKARSESRSIAPSTGKAMLWRTLATSLRCRWACVGGRAGVSIKLRGTWVLSLPSTRSYSWGCIRAGLISRSWSQRRGLQARWMRTKTKDATALYGRLDVSSRIDVRQEADAVSSGCFSRSCRMSADSTFRSSLIISTYVTFHLEHTEGTYACSLTVSPVE